LIFRTTDSDDNQRYGLGEDWLRIQSTLQDVIPVYTKVNRYISLGTDLKIRREGISLLISYLHRWREESLTILDLGSGLGKMAESLLEYTRDQNKEQRLWLVRLDALESMLRAPTTEKSSGSDGIVGIFEQLPFRNESYHAAVAGFAIRDAQNLQKALREVRASLKTEGMFLIVDLSKPDSKFKSKILGLYWLVFSPLLASLASFRLGRKFGALYTTFARLPNRTTFLNLANLVGLEVVEQKYHMLGGSAVIMMKKKGTGVARN
jgi:demethylmenaquinone methyltransferase / 2-methoxy-6-polyprenyl-1,4-benzoquinol methylase